MSAATEEKKKTFVPNPKELDGVPDLSSLIYLEEPHVVHNVKCRYNKDLIYTGISSVLVAVNPYKQLGCYTNERITHYANKAKYEKGLPHVYNVAEQAYRQLIWSGKNQSLIVCGESGAGKTENAKFLMRHLAYTTSIGLYCSNKSSSMVEEKLSSDTAMTSAKIEQQILAANPILESFGNAKTLLNNNSSRFGKFTKLLFNKAEKDGEGGNIVGSAMETYLLEKSRVVFQAKGERNYHVFYQMCAGLKTEELKELGIIGGAEDFAYLNQSDCVEIPGIADDHRFEELVQAMDLLGFDAESKSKLFCSVAAVMHLGNVEFESASKTSDACKIAEDEDGVSQYSVQMAAHLLEIKEEDLVRRLTKQSIKIRGKVIWKDYDLAGAESNRDSTAKAIYAALFDWVVLKINTELFLSKLEAKRNALLEKEKAEKKKKEEEEKLKKEEEERLKKIADVEKKLEKKEKKKKKPKKKLNSKFAMFESKAPAPAPPIRRRKGKKKKVEAEEPEEKEMSMDDLDNDPSIKWIGILDVFGFECFDYNSFEQFCINFTNETLQRYFNYNIMLSEQAEYQREGIFWKPIELPDNKPTLDLINKRPGGIFYLLDSAGQMPKADDKTFTTLIFKEHKKHPMIKKMNTNPRIKQTGRQKAYINGFQISHYAMPVTYDAKEFLIKNADRVHEDSVDLFCSSKSKLVAKLLRKLKGKKSKKRTLGYVFSEQLRTLMKNLHKTKPFFVRCIKPNLKKKSGMFNDQYVADQLRCGGLIEAIKIIKCGYPTRVQYDAIFDRYGPSVFKNDRKKMACVNRRDFCEAILRSFNKNRSHFEMGLTKVFFKGQQEAFLEELMRKGGANWQVPADLVSKIKKHLIRKRIQRVGGFMKAYGIWLVRLRRMRAMAKWAYWSKVAVVITKTVYPSMERAKSKVATRTITAALRTAVAMKRFKDVRKAVIFMQRYYRHASQRSALIAELNRRIKKKLDAQSALAANKLKGLNSDEIVKVVAEQAAKWLGKVVFKKVASNLFDGLADGVALVQMCKKLDTACEFKEYSSAAEGSALAKKNIEAALASMSSMGIPKEALFDVDDLALMKNPRKVVNSIAAMCAKAALKNTIPGISPFPTVKFEIEEARIAGKDDEKIEILLFGEGGALEDMDDERKKELIQPGYLDKKREFERKAMEMERERKRKLAEMVEREKKAKAEAAEKARQLELEKKRLAEEREKQRLELEKERQEFLEWKRQVKEQKAMQQKKAEELARQKKKEEEEAPKVDPEVERKRQFFEYTVAAVLRRFEEHGLLRVANLQYDDFNSRELLEESEKENVEWHLWNDWITQRVRARIEKKLASMKRLSNSSAAQRKQPLPALPPKPSEAGIDPRLIAQAKAAKKAQQQRLSTSQRASVGQRTSDGKSKSSQEYRVNAPTRRRRQRQKKSIIVSISGPKPPPPKLPPPKNAKRYHRRRSYKGGQQPRSNMVRASVPRPMSRPSAIQEGEGVEEKKECAIQ